MLALTVLTSTLGTLQASASPVDDAQSDTAWIMASRVGNVIATTPSHQEILPYEGNYAAWGLADYSKATGDLSRVHVAWRWLYWFAAHMRPDFDYAVCQYKRAGDGSWQIEPSGNGTDPCDTDSTDATAGLFMSAALAAYQVDPRRYRQRLARLHGAIANAIHTIDATMSPDGLTSATPSWPVEYLMDNAEAYGGLRATVQLGKALGDTALSQHALDDARRERQGMNTVLWNGANQSYDWAKHLDHDRESVPCRWDILYPDAVEEAWAVAYGVPTTRAVKTHLMDMFWNPGNHGDWKDPNGEDWYYDASACPNSTCKQPVGYWPLVGLAFIKAGNMAEAAAGARSIHDAAVADDRAKPFSVGWAGMLVRLELAVASS